MSVDTKQQSREQRHSQCHIGRADRAMLKLVVGHDPDKMRHPCRSSGSGAGKEKIVRVMESAKRENQVKQIIMEQCQSQKGKKNESRNETNKEKLKGQ